MQEAVAEALQELGIVETRPQYEKHRKSMRQAMHVQATDNSGPVEIIEIKETFGKGLGTFAVQDIPKGARILSEVPLLELPPPAMSQSGWAQEVANQFEALPSEKQGVVSNLHCQMEKPLLQRLAVEAIVSEEVRSEEIRISDVSDIQDIPEGPLKRKIRVAGTFQTNAFGLFGHTPDNVHVAIFERASRINHSCAPNTWHSWNPKTEKHNIHAIRDIKAEEELTTEYTDCLAIKEDRQKILKSYGFDCRCQVCDNREAESRRVEIQFLKNEEFGQYKQQLVARGHLSSEDIGNAIDVVKALLALYEEERSIGIHAEEM